MMDRKNVLRAAALLALFVLLLTGCGRKQNAVLDLNADLQLIDQTEDQKAQVVVISTSYGTVKYPFAFSDLIRVYAENQEDRAVLKFCAWLNNTEYPLYSLIFDGDEGFPVGELTRKDGTAISVTVQFFEADPAMDADEMQSFYAVQETVNDVIQSLAENKHFTAAQ